MSHLIAFNCRGSPSNIDTITVWRRFDDVRCGHKELSKVLEQRVIGVGVHQPVGGLLRPGLVHVPVNVEVRGEVHSHLDILRGQLLDISRHECVITLDMMAHLLE